MKRILIIDTYYPDFLKQVTLSPTTPYEDSLKSVLWRSFGTSDFYSRTLQSLGWEVSDVIANFTALQHKWWMEASGKVLEAQIEDFNPDVLFFQDLSLIDSIPSLALRNRLVAGQLSCPWPGDHRVRQFHVLFTSFPHYMERFNALGVKGVYNPLGFDPIVLERMGDVPKERIHDVVFIGGVGAPSHWAYGMQVLNTVAEAIPTFKWWGYGANQLPNGPLKDKYQGEAWGLDMYRIMSQSKIVLNRHGEVAQQFANNMRMFEATGCGALLLNDAKVNFSQFFEPDEADTYVTPSQAVDRIRYHLGNEEHRATIAAKGRVKTLTDHTYAKRMETVSNALTEMLVAA